MTILAPLFALALLLPAASELHPAPCGACCDGIAYRHEATGSEFPWLIGGLEYRGIRTYEKPKLGISLEYKGLEAVLSIYLYTGDYEAIPDGPASEAALAELAGAARALSSPEAWERAADLEEQSGVAAVSIDCGTWEFQQAAFRVVHRGAEYVSYLLVTGALDHLVKIRLTLPAEEGEASERDLYADVLATVTELLLRASGQAGTAG